MQLIHMRPSEIQAATEADLPLILGCGVVEHHGPHLPVGTDYLIASSVVTEVERRAPEHCVLAPGFPFGPTGSWAGGPTDGELDLDSEPFFRYVKPILAGYLEMGFRQVLICQHHQGPDGPQQLCLRRAAAELAMRHGQREGGGAGWGRLPREQSPKVFGRIKVVSPTAFVEGEPLNIRWGHAGHGETEYIRGVYPKSVDMSALDNMSAPAPPWLSDAHTADGSQGGQWFERCVAGWVNQIQRQP